jgi:dethiobiotin synthetase
MANEHAPPGLFITGTSTEVGKTYIAAAIAAQLYADGRRVGVYKPVASGCLQQTEGVLAEDALALWQAAGQPGSLADVCPQSFLAPLAPPLAAEAMGQRVDSALLREGITCWQQQSEIILVEGSGGLMSPISDTDCVANLANDLGYPLLIVAANQLGVVNQVLQTAVTARTVCPGLELAGVVLNQVSPGGLDQSLASNRALIEKHSQCAVLADVGLDGTLPSSINWFDLARTPCCQEAQS